MGFRICVYVCVCVVRYWAILLCGRSWLVTQGRWVVVVRVAITEQVLNYPPDVRCGGGRQCLCEEGWVGWVFECPSGRGQSPVSYVKWSAQWPCVARRTLCLMTVAIITMMRIT